MTLKYTFAEYTSMIFGFLDDWDWEKAPIHFLNIEKTSIKEAQCLSDVLWDNNYTCLVFNLGKNKYQLAIIKIMEKRQRSKNA